LLWFYKNKKYLLSLDDLKKAINENFGSCDELKQKLATASIAVQGSGWGWLGIDPTTKKLSIATCLNQDPLFPTTGKIIF